MLWSGKWRFRILNGRLLRFQATLDKSSTLNSSYHSLVIDARLDDQQPALDISYPLLKLGSSAKQKKTAAESSFKLSTGGFLLYVHLHGRISGSCVFAYTGMGNLRTLHQLSHVT